MGRVNMKTWYSFRVEDEQRKKKPMKILARVID